MPHLISERFARNIMNNNFTIKGLYPNDPHLYDEDAVYIPSEVFLLTIVKIR